MSLSEKLIAAAKNGDLREVRKLLARGALFTKDQFGNTALHEAAWNGYNDIVKTLLGKSFCFVDSLNSSGFTPLHLASQNGHAKVVKTLLKWKADPSLHNQHGETALHLVAKYNHVNVISVFSAAKVNLDAGGKDGNSALHIAAKLGNMESIKALVHGGADPWARNDKGQYPLNCAESGTCKEAVKYLSELRMKRQRSGSLGNNGVIISPEFPEGLRSPLRVSRSTGCTARVSGRAKKKNSFPLEPTSVKETVGSLSQNCFLPEQSSEASTRYDCTGQATIDQMLNDIERECQGSEATVHFSTYEEQGPELPPRHYPAKAFLRSTRDGQKPLKDNYDILEPASPRPASSKSSAAPSSSRKLFKNHKYETLLPKEPEDGDTYVYMAPLKEFSKQASPSKASNGSAEEAQACEEKVSKQTKKAVICSSPVEANTRHEPSDRQPHKGILAQTSTEVKTKTQLDKYLQDELETMRQAFQIRLSQLEKRYQRRLVMEQRRNSRALSSGSSSHSPSSTPTATLERRKSWNGSSDDESEGEKPRAGSVMGIRDSDTQIDESVIGRDKRQPSECRAVQSPGLKGGSPAALTHREEEQVMSPVMTFSEDEEEGDESLTEDARQLIQLRIQEYRAKMTRHFTEKAEAKIAVIEEQYQKQMTEVKKKCEISNSEKFTLLESRIRELESAVRAQTLV